MNASDLNPRRGITLVEILVAVCILSMGIVPIFFMMTSTRQMTKAGIQELQAMSLGSSMIEGLNRIPAHEFQQLVPDFAAPVSDAEFKKSVPASFSLPALGVPECPPGFQRNVRLELKSAPNLPAQRFTDPWGRIIEISVEIKSAPRDGTKSPAPDKSLLKIKACRVLAEAE